MGKKKKKKECSKKEGRGSKASVNLVQTHHKLGASRASAHEQNNVWMVDVANNTTQNEEKLESKHYNTIIREGKVIYQKIAVRHADKQTHAQRQPASQPARKANSHIHKQDRQADTWTHRQTNKHT